MDGASVELALLKGVWLGKQRSQDREMSEEEAPRVWAALPGLLLTVRGASTARVKPVRWVWRPGSRSDAWGRGLRTLAEAVVFGKGTRPPLCWAHMRWEPMVSGNL